MTFKRILLTLIFLLTCFSLFANTPLKSIQEDYFDYLVLTGRAERPYLVYRSLDNNVYSNENGIWKDCFVNTEINTGKKLNVSVYGPEVFMSYNTERPLGQNDGALWQGVGLNAQAKAGVSVEGYGFSFTFKPEVDFSQNKEFQTVVTEYNKDNPNNYFWGNHAPYDLPQRFGEESFFTFDFGDSEVRYSYGSLTAGFGTSAFWIGPTYLNSLLHSNNAATYPRFDVGLNKIAIPRHGNLEAHYSIGMLTKSKYSTNEIYKKTLLNLISVGYNFKYLPYLTVGAEFVSHTSCDSDGFSDFLHSLVFHSNNTEDSKMALSFDFLLPESGFEVYGECAWDDYCFWITKCFHTMYSQIGLKKSIDIFDKYGVYTELIAEVGILSSSRDRFADVIGYNHNLYTHGDNPGSYTNQGQLLGAGTGYGGNSQYVGLNFFYEKGMTTFYGQRSNPDNNYIYDLVTHAGVGSEYFHCFKGMFDLGLKSTYFINDRFSVSGGLVENIIITDQYGTTGDSDNENVFNSHLELSAKYYL